LGGRRLMGLYLGSSKKLRINLNNTLVCLSVPLFTPISNSINLISIDNYNIKDSNGLYLTAKKGE
jgi:hypothetical protein